MYINTNRWALIIILINSKRNVIENSNFTKPKYPTSGRKSKVQEILQSEQLTNKEKTKLILSHSQGIPPDDLNQILEEFPEVKPVKIRETIRFEEPLDSDRINYFEEHSEYEVNNYGKILYKPLQNELQQAKEKSKNLETIIDQLKSIGENSKKENEILKTQVSEQQKKLEVQREKHAKEVRDKVISLERTMQELKEENLSVKMGKYKLEDIVYAELKKNLATQQENLVNKLSSMSSLFEEGVKSYSTFNSLTTEIVQKEKKNVQQVEQRNEINRKLGQEIGQVIEEVKSLRLKVDKQERLISTLRENLQDQSLINQFDDFVY